MKPIIALPAAWIIFGIGQLYHWITNLWDNEYWVAFWFPLYQDLMITSVEIQDWAGGEAPLFPWGDEHESS